MVWLGELWNSCVYPPCVNPYLQTASNKKKNQNEILITFELQTQLSTEMADFSLYNYILVKTHVK